MKFLKKQRKLPKFVSACHPRNVFNMMQGSLWAVGVTQYHVAFILHATRRPEMSDGHYQSWADLLTVRAYHRRRPKYIFNMLQGIRTPVRVRI